MRSTARGMGTLSKSCILVLFSMSLFSCIGSTAAEDVASSAAHSCYGPYFFFLPPFFSAFFAAFCSAFIWRTDSSV